MKWNVKRKKRIRAPEWLPFHSMKECDDLCFIFFSIHMYIFVRVRRCFNIRFICTFLRLSYVLWYHTAFTVDMSWVEFCSRSGIHLAFIYSDTINHKRITSHTLNRPMVRCVERKRVSERMSEQANKIQEIPFIATDEWSKWYCTNRTNERTYAVYGTEQKTNW